jgi:hypothetical protein
MYTIGRYYQGNPDQKPEQWGSIADVRYAVRANCEDWLGVDYSKLIFAVPGWQGTDKKIIDLGCKSNGFGTQLVKGTFDKKYGINLINPSYAYLNSTLHNNDGEEFSLFFDFIKRGSSTVQNKLAGYNNSIVYGYIAIYPGIKSRIAFNTAVDFTSTQVFNKRNQLVFVCDKNKNVKAYQNASLKQTLSTSNTEFDFNQIGSGNSYTSIDDATIYNSFGFKTALNTQHVELLSNQPYKLFQPVSRPLYFDLSSLPTGSLDFIFNASNTSVLNTTINLQRNNLINIETADTINTIDNNIVRNSIVDVQNMSAIDNITTLLNRYCTIDIQNMSVIDSVTSLLNRYYDVDVQNMSTVANIVSLLNRYYTVDVQNTFVIDSIISLLNRYYTIGIENSVSIEDILISTGNILYFSLALENGLIIPNTYLYKNINCSIEPTNNSTIDDIVFSVVRCLEADLLNNTTIDTIVYNVIRAINVSLENTEYILDIPVFIKALLNVLKINGYIKEIFTGNIKEIYNGTIN